MNPTGSLHGGVSHSLLCYPVGLFIRPENFFGKKLPRNLLIFSWKPVRFHRASICYSGSDVRATLASIA
jgi:hypothetical protein